MDTLETIFTRRSIRKFTNTPIEKDILLNLIKAGMYAPSARNTQAWHFILCTERETLDKIPDIHPHAAMCFEAQAVIIVCGDLSIEPSAEYNAINCSAATQNILLAAHSIGLGSVWLGVFPRSERVAGVTNLLSLPSNIIPVSMIALGYPGETKGFSERYKNERIHLNKW